MAAIDERKALDHLTRSMRNLATGARLGAAEPPPDDGEEPAPGAAQAADAQPESPNPPPPQS